MNNSHEFVPDSNELEIEGCLRDAGAAAVEERWDTPRWTKELKTRIAKLPFARGLTAYSHEHPDGEWLYDLTLLKQTKGSLDRCVLAAESEWGRRSDVSNDFQKLILARADYRLMIYEVFHEDDADRIARDLIAEVANFESRAEGDRYMFAAWVQDRFRFYTLDSFKKDDD